MPPERSAGTRKPKFATSATIPTIRLHLFGEPVPLGRDPVKFGPRATARFELLRNKRALDSLLFSDDLKLARGEGAAGRRELAAATLHP
jgi:hypothetical protein